VSDSQQQPCQKKWVDVKFSHLPSFFPGGAMSAQHFLRVERPKLGAIPAFNRDAAALARATRARAAFQLRLVDTFRTYLEGEGPEPSDSALRTFALLAAEEHRLEQRLANAAVRSVAGPTHEVREAPAFGRLR
jgi:hypothetical protein